MILRFCGLNELLNERFNNGHKIRKLTVAMRIQRLQINGPGMHHAGYTAWGAAASSRPGGRPLRYTVDWVAADGLADAPFVEVAKPSAFPWYMDSRDEGSRVENTADVDSNDDDSGDVDSNDDDSGNKDRDDACSAL